MHPVNAAAAGLLALSVADVATTAVGLHLGAREANRVMAWLLAEFGMSWMLSLRLMLGAVSGLLLWRFALERAAGRIGLYAVCLGLAGVVAGNALVIGVLLSEPLPLPL